MLKITVNGKTIIDTSKNKNNISIKDNCIQINGDVISSSDDIKNINTICIYGDVENIETDKSVSCNDVKGNINAGGSVNCDDVDGYVIAGGSVNCDDIGGNVSAGGSIRCG